MSWFRLVGLAVMLVALETYAYHRNPRRSVWRRIDGDRVAVTVGLAWWAAVVGVSWVNDNDPLGGAFYGLLGAAILGSSISMTRRSIARRRTTAPSWTARYSTTSQGTASGSSRRNRPM
ncbi:hypothetical protein ABZ383_23475 [Streptomyces sp. NPDC005900]|uniref:hypothetical protein n=1 Tax=unclassified Streptomyces TaxID=2593676 RepID=UPI0033F84DCE